jgi:hypothetical protein
MQASQMSDDLTLVRGNHQLAVGGSLAYWQFHFLSHARSGGNWNFTGQLTGLGLADLLMGRVGRLEHGGPAILPMEQWYTCLYAQDAWRMSGRITTQRRLRWEPYLGQNVTNGSVYNFSRDNFKNNVKTSQYVNAPAGLIYPGDPGFPPGLSGVNKQWLNVSPRVGLAWDVSGDGRAAIRGSYGLTYDMPNGEYELINANSPPFGNRTLVEDPPGGFDHPYTHSVAIRIRFSRAAIRRSSSTVHSAPLIRHQRTAYPAVERDRREAAWTRVAGGSELSGQLYRSPVEPGRHQSRRVPRDLVRARCRESSIRPAARTEISISAACSHRTTRTRRRHCSLATSTFTKASENSPIEE